MATNNIENSTSPLGIRLSSVMNTYSTRKSVVKLGIDVLEQLIALRDKGTKCAVITPADIYVSPLGEFSLGAVSQRPPEKSDKFSHLVQLYTAPEAYDRIDGDGPALYSLGTVMYKLLNGGLEPFRSALDFESASSAYKLRISGLRLSAPANADALLSAIIIKACEYNPGKRYMYAEDMLEELMLLADGNYQRKPRTQLSEKPLEEETPVKKAPLIACGIGGAVVALLIIIFVVNFRCNDTYIRAERYMRDGKLDRAEQMLNSISWYKDSAKLLLKCDFYRADHLLIEGKTDDAIEIYEELVKSNYTGAKEALNDALLIKAQLLMDEGKTDEAMELLTSVAEDNNEEAGELIEERKYDTAMELYTEEEYAKAKEIFVAIGMEDMARECDYCIATEYKKLGEYTEAMAIFNSLDGYNDSNEQFDICEEWLLDDNKEQPMFKSFKNMSGRFSDDNGYYAEYTIDGESIRSKYTLPFEEGEYFRLNGGIHYNSTDGEHWEKQWIFRVISPGKLSVYNYIDGKVYVLVKQ